MKKFICLLMGWSAWPPRTTVASPPVTPSPAHQWASFLFTPDGYREMTLRGDEVRPISADVVEVVDLNITRYSGDAADRITTILLSPEATFDAKKNRAAGPKSVRLIADNVEITGEDWTYESAGEKVSIRRNVRVVFKAQINDLLK